MNSQLFTCESCSSPWIDKRAYPDVFESLDTLPIGWCDCREPELKETEFGQADFREAYWLALSDTLSDKQDNVSVLLDERILQELEWVKRKQDDWWITTKGRRLLPLCLIVANDLHKA